MVSEKEREAVQYLNGERLRQAVIAGAHRVIAHREVLDRINVFPVPDSDTGTNLTATMQAIIRGLKYSQPSLAAVSATVASSALTGACGNSGVIMAQFFQGLREGIAEHLRVSVAHFVRALRRASNQAREALAKPQEGTILTVISDFVDHIEKRAEQLGNFLSVLEEGLRVAQQSLAETKNTLAVLRKAGVVDAGALGFVHFLEGFVGALKGWKSEEVASVSPYEAKLSPAPTGLSERIDFRYCTEAVVSGKRIDRGGLKHSLAPLGESIVVAGTEQEVHVHIHSNVPAHVLEVLSELGDVFAQKVDDMLVRIELLPSSMERTGIALVTDSVCDLPQSFLTAQRIRAIPVQVAFGEEKFLDRVEITPRQFYTKLTTENVSPKTSQPSPADFLLVYRYLSQFYAEILSVHLSAEVSGTYQTALTAARTVSKETGVPIRVVDSRTASAGEGLVVWAAARAIEAGLSLDACCAVAQDAVAGTSIFVFVPTVEYFVRGGRLSPIQGKIAEWLHLKPVLTVKDGKVASAGKALGWWPAVRKTLAFVTKIAWGMEKPAFVIAHSTAPKLAQHYAEVLSDTFPTSSVMMAETAPALGAHAGPGGAAIAVLDAATVDRALETASKRRES